MPIYFGSAEGSQLFILHKNGAYKLYAGGHLHYCADEKAQLVLFNQEDRERVLTECHNDTGGAHQGICRTQEKVKSLYYWMAITADVESWVNIDGIACSVIKVIRYCCINEIGFPRLLGHIRVWVNCKIDTFAEYVVCMGLSIKYVNNLETIFLLICLI